MTRGVRRPSPGNQLVGEEHRIELPPGTEPGDFDASPRFLLTVTE